MPKEGNSADAPLVTSASIPSTCGRLERLIFGEPLSERKSADCVCAELDALLFGIADLIEQKMGTSEAVGQAASEWRDITRLPHDYFGVACRRGALLFALHEEQDVRVHFMGSGEEEFVRKMCEGVLPLLVPAYTNAFMQTPDRLVVATSVVWSMWGWEMRAAQPT